MDKTVLYTASPLREASLHLFSLSGFLGTHFLGPQTTIGRTSSQGTCDIAINSAIVSRRHGQIAQSDSGYFYQDLGSTNGTYVNGKRYGCGVASAVPLTDGDIISFEVSQPDAMASSKVIGLFASTATPFQWQQIQLREDMAELCVGRDVTTGLEVNDASVSKKHASFFQSKNGWAIIDHNSTNGVILNGKRISYPRYLSPLDVVRLADTYFVFLGDTLFFSNGQMTDTQFIPDAPAKVPVDGDTDIQAQFPGSRPNAQNCADQLCINIYQRSVVQRFKKMMLLQNIKMTINNGEMVLILGGSGAGKTTFINAVMGYEKAEGKITYRDTDIYEEYEQMKFEIGFVPQQDLLRSSDTVYDTLANAAEMKMPKRINSEEREERINFVLEELGLAREKNSLVSKLSGGQKKRLSIAVELISDPSLFFLDEPDSGLDDIMGRGLMENLRRIADRGKIVMIITHSPERATGLFDKVIVLAKSTKDNSGHLAFYGSVKQAFSFFEVSSFQEIVKKINRRDENGEGLSDYFIEKYISVIDGVKENE